MKVPTPEELRYTSQLLEARSYTAHHKEVGMYYCGLDISMKMRADAQITDLTGRENENASLILLHSRRSDNKKDQASS